MEHSLLSRNDILFQCARMSTISARTSSSQNNFQKVSDSKIRKCSNKHPKCSNEQTPKASDRKIRSKLSDPRASARTSHKVLERATKCSNGHPFARTSIIVLTFLLVPLLRCLLILCLVHVLSLG
jgi:hypothetical protein